MNILRNKGEIYKITSPCGKIYIGQTKCLAKRKDKFIIWGTIKRWKAHINEANSLKREGCLKLNNCINKYKAENFVVEVLLICDIEYLDYYEAIWKILKEKVPQLTLEIPIENILIKPQEVVDKISSLTNVSFQLYNMQNHSITNMATPYREYYASHFVTS